MQLNTRVSYGVRALVNLALADPPGRPVPVKDISVSERIPGVYLEQILNRLKKNGLVMSHKGPGGGYVLSRDPSDICVMDVVNAVNKDLRRARCYSRGRTATTCPRFDVCAFREVREEVKRLTEQALYGFSIRCLAENTRKLERTYGRSYGQDIP